MPTSPAPQHKRERHINILLLLRPCACLGSVRAGDEGMHFLPRINRLAGTTFGSRLRICRSCCHYAQPAELPATGAISESSCLLHLPGLILVFFKAGPAERGQGCVMLSKTPLPAKRLQRSGPQRDTAASGFQPRHAGCGQRLHLRGSAWKSHFRGLWAFPTVGGEPLPSAMVA